MLLSANWSVAWLMTGMGIGVVFVILCLLVLVLLVFSAIAQKTAKPKVEASATAAPTKNDGEASELDKAAVATAVYLYQMSKGDQESGVLTIKKTSSAWHAVLNERL